MPSLWRSMGFFLAVGLLAAAPDAPRTPKEALQPFNELIGGWKGAGEPEGSAQEKQRGFWKESVSFGWKFKGEDAWIAVSFQNSKHYKEGAIRFLPEKNKYQLQMIAKDGETLTFEGQPDEKGRNFSFERLDKKETQRVTISLVGDIRFKYSYDYKPEGRRLFVKAFQVTGTREGESFGSKEKKPECIVSGGLGTMVVAYKGLNYYVCCSGCRDEFNANPEKYIKEWNEKKAKGAQP